MTAPLRLLTFLLVILALPACSAGTALNIATSSGGASVVHDIAYGSDKRQTLDVYMPRDARSAPVAIFFYGGTWQSGDKATYTFVASALAAKGIVVLVPDYRLYPQVRYPAFLQDGAAVVRWAKDHARTYGGNPSKIYVVGHSAGAYNAAMLTLDKQWLDQQKLAPSRDIKGFVGISGPYDFLPFDDKKVADIFSPARTPETTQPINHVGPGNPPVLLLHGESDDVVYPRNSTALAAKLRAAGSPVALKLYPGVGHIGIIGAMGSPLRFLAPTLNDTADFILGRRDKNGS
ncbi:alpha/beta hydrolase (plasmid) [Phyllobacterium sp. 628]|uniref:alpha/beta hydrolase n=1 Tax=Phyllobacterium sp. 628 TaxID=2718938 RepID=UPI0016624CB2|nr:alpha/beta hydrolase [Phyllobacterium sp. 628]QND54900.1 alpha/beta hydrolase [Phyllobacterium sp. 628]